MNKIYGIVFGLLMVGWQTAWAYYPNNVEAFQKYNPDGQKYAFTKAYIQSLLQLKKNQDRSERIFGAGAQLVEQQDFFEDQIKALVQDNAHLRVARNLLSRFLSSENKLILKITGLFVKVCDEQVAINNRERAYLQQIKTKTSKEGQKQQMAEALGEIQALARERRQALQGLLEASMYVKTLLISSQPNQYDEFVLLGVTEEQRDYLLDLLDAFEEDGFRGQLREGQSFLEGSVAVIRSVLEDDHWGTLVYQPGSIVER